MMENTPQPTVTLADQVVTSALTTLGAIPVIVIVGLVVLLALHDIDSTAGLALIGTLAGVHGGAALKS